MTDGTDIIEIDREELAQYCYHLQRGEVEFDSESYANLEENPHDLVFDDTEEAAMFAEGARFVITGQQLELYMMGIDVEGLAEEWIEEHGHESFENPPFDEDGETHATD